MTSKSIEVSDEIGPALDRLAKLARDMSPVMGEVASQMTAITQKRFMTETGPDLVPWIKSKRVTGYTKADGTKVPGDGGQTLTLHGWLRRSIRSNWGADFAETGPEGSGPAAVYARVHQEGGTIRPREGTKALHTPFGHFGAVQMPARPYLGWNGELEEATLDILTKHIQRVLDGEA